MKFNTLLAGAAAAALSCAPADISQAPAETGQKDQESQRLSEAIRTIEYTKAELIHALGASLEGYRVFEKDGRPTAVACVANSSGFDAYHQAAAAARGTVRENSERAVTSFNNDSREQEVEGGTVACVQSTATSFEGE